MSELEKTLKTEIKSKEEMLIACRKILDKGAERVLLSLGKNGAVITDGSKSFYCKSVNVAMNSTIGAGDGMVAAASNALIKGGSLEEVLRCGVAGERLRSPCPTAFRSAKTSTRKYFPL